MQRCAVVMCRAPTLLQKRLQFETLRCTVQAFAIQSYVTGEGPYANWSKHVADPFGYNLLTIVGNEDRLPTL